MLGKATGIEAFASPSAAVAIGDRQHLSDASVFVVESNGIIVILLSSSV